MNLLRPFVVTAAHSGKEDFSDLEPAVREIFIESAVSKDPQRLNVFLFALSSEGRVVHQFHGVPGGRRSVEPGRADHQVEIQKARAKLGLPDVNSPTADEVLRGLPDLKGLDAGVPAGVRLFIRQDDTSNSHFCKVPVVEVVPMKPGEWQPLSLAPEAREVQAEALKSWFVWLYPAAIRTADEHMRFQEFKGTLKLEPAGSDGKLRYALLRGKLRLAKGDETLSAFEGELQAVLSYGQDAPEVRSVRGVIKGVYLYRIRDTSPQKLRVVMESRP